MRSIDFAGAQVTVDIDNKVYKDRCEQLEDGRMVRIVLLKIRVEGVPDRTSRC